LVPVETLLNHALQLNPNLRSVNYRLGLINMLQGDFPAATADLDRAYQLDLQTCCSVHRGIYKTLAYSYVWDKNYAQAMPLLRKLPEADDELKYYEIWWEQQGRKDLALVAREMLDLLDGAKS